MLNFNTIEDLVSHMLESTDNEDNLVSVITDKEMSVEIMKELLDYENVILDSCNIDFDEEYDREYIVSLLYDVDSDNWYVNIDKSYLSDNDKYVFTGGYILFHEDVNSKAMVDMQNNKFMPLGDHDWFVIGETEADDETERTYMINGEPADKETFNEYVSTFKEDYYENHDPGYMVTVKVDLDTNEAEKLIRNMEKDMRRELSDMFDLLYRPYLYEYRPAPIRFFW